MDSTYESRHAAEAAKERRRREWMMGGGVVLGVMSVLAIILSLVAIGSTSTNNGAAQPIARMIPASAPGATPASAAVATPAPTALKLVVKSDDEHGKRGPDGTWHDAFLPANFAVHAGQAVTVTVYNYDTGGHSFTAPSLGVNATIAAGSEKAPHITTFKFIAPSQPGSYDWWCSVPCDPWAMGTDGYMKGTVTVRA